jgi:hypothetical protein
MSFSISSSFKGFAKTAIDIIRISFTIGEFKR